MLEARVVKTGIMRTEDDETLLVGVAMYGDESVNFKVPYEWEEISEATEAFSMALRDKIAEVFDLTLYHVDMADDEFIHKMREFDMKRKGFLSE